MEVTRASGRIVLVCEECGKRTVLEGALSAWRREGTAIGCECGRLLGSAGYLEALAADSERRS